MVSDLQQRSLRGSPIKVATTQQSHNGIKYRVYYRKIKYPRLEFKTGKLELILPLDTSPNDLIEKRKNWINRKQAFIKKCLNRSNHKRIIPRTENTFKELIFNITSNLSNELQVKINKLYFREMRTKWASCSHKRNLTLNKMMKYLPAKQVEYIMYHELIHLIEKRHNDRFCRIIAKRFKNYKNLESSLFPYWFLVNDKARREG